MPSRPITALLQDFAAGDKSALDRLMPLVYAELKKLASGYLRRDRTGHTLQPTALVHEAYARLIGQNQPDYANRGHFLGVASRVMRQILTDHARARLAGKRGAGQQHFSLDEAIESPGQKPTSIIELNDALDTLERDDPQKAKLIEMRFFGGMTAEESAAALGLPVEKIRSELRVAQAWLRRELQRRPTPSK